MKCIVLHLSRRLDWHGYDVGTWIILFNTNGRNGFHCRIFANAGDIIVVLPEVTAAEIESIG